MNITPSENELRRSEIFIERTEGKCRSSRGAAFAERHHLYLFITRRYSLLSCHELHPPADLYTFFTFALAHEKNIDLTGRVLQLKSRQVDTTQPQAAGLREKRLFGYSILNNASCTSNQIIYRPKFENTKIRVFVANL